jgi:hypothetical protein
VDHLDEVARAVRTAVQVALLGGPGRPFASGVRGAAPMPGARAEKIGSRRFTISFSPPIIWQ